MQRSGIDTIKYHTSNTKSSVIDKYCLMCASKLTELIESVHSFNQLRNVYVEDKYDDLFVQNLTQSRILRFRGTGKVTPRTQLR